MSVTHQVIKVQGWAPESRLPDLVERLDRVNKQARKLGVNPIVYRRGAEEDRVVHRRQVFDTTPPRVIETKARFVQVEIEGSIPVLPGGWTLVAVVNHAEGLPIVKNVPGHELPAGQRERGTICDHCHTARGRKDTFVVVAEDGRVQQVGRNCLADFLGVSAFSPEALLALVTFLGDPLGGLSMDEEDFGYEGFQRGRVTIDVVEIVTIAGAFIDEYGWTSRARANAEGTGATADQVVRFLFPPSRPQPSEIEERTRIRTRFTEALATEARAAIEWARAYEGVEDYPLNLKVIASREVVGYDKLGLTVSLIASYRREQERLRERERKAKSSRFVGEVGKRDILTLKLVAHRAIEGYYGTTHRCEFDLEGATLVWWASNDPTYGPGAWQIGEERRVKATVKKHEEFKGLKTTVVTRVAEVAK